MNPMRTVLFILLLLASTFSSALAQTNNCIDVELPPNPRYTFDDNLVITSDDGVAIAANVFQPTQTPPINGFPAVILVNSWTKDEYQYLDPAAQFAEKGYIVLSYSARGWGCSGGEVNVSAGKDMQDLNRIVDWLINNTPIDPENIGIAGISYGSGIATRGLAFEPRIKTAIGMSTWASLTEALYLQETPRLFWGFFLLTSGAITANLDPKIPQSYWNLITHQNIEQTLDWAKERSVSYLIDEINARGAPIFLSNNFSDNLFQPNNLLHFFDKLTVPKRLDMNQGIHAITEGLDMSPENYTWNNVHRWFDYWLKGENTGIVDEPKVSFEIAHTHNGEKRRESYQDWPLPELKQERYYLAPRGPFSNGRLQPTQYNPWLPRTNTIASGFDTTATTGIPALSALLSSYANLPVFNYLHSVSRVNGIVYESDSLEKDLKIRGIPEISLHLNPSLRRFQLQAYLYDVSPTGIARLITHGPVTRYAAERGTYQQIDWEMVATAYDVPAGHKVALALDTFDVLYAVPTLIPYSVKFLHTSAHQSTLTLPTVN